MNKKVRNNFKQEASVFIKAVYNSYGHAKFSGFYLFCVFIYLPCALYAGPSQISANSVPGQIPLRLGSGVELFVDDYLIDRLGGKTELRLHHPRAKEIVLVHDAPWEGSGSGYHSIFKDGDVYKMYYKAWQLTVSADGSLKTDHPLFTCYAESNDGIHWRKPDLQLYEFQGARANNIVLGAGKYQGLDSQLEIGNLSTGHPAVFKDNNPDAAPGARFKAFLPSFSAPKGLLPFKSADGIHWSLMSNEPVITDGIFDSQNLAFWDSAHHEYRAYWRSSSEGVRAINTAVSPDFIHWSKQAYLLYTDSPPEELYTSQVKPYYRAPQILLGFPARYTVRGWSESMRALPEREHREWRSISSERHGTVVTESLFMAGRDGVTFKRWNEAFLRPGIERPGTWAYGNQYIGWGIVETKAAGEGAPNELSLYATESYWTGKSDVLRRYTLRIDGFVSVNAPMSGGELITKPLTFTGSNLVLNFSTSAAGGIRVEIQDAAGNALPGFSMNDCPEIFGDSIERVVIWKNGSDLSSVKGKPVRLRFILKDADLFSLRFK